MLREGGGAWGWMRDMTANSMMMAGNRAALRHNHSPGVRLVLADLVNLAITQLL